MLEQQVALRASEYSENITSHKMVLISHHSTEAVQLFELFTQTPFDICYTRYIDDALISAVKPKVLVYQFSASHNGNNEKQLDYPSILLTQLKRLQQFNIPIILLLEEAVYIACAPIDRPNVTLLLWPSSSQELISTLLGVVDQHKQFSKYEDSILFKDLVIDTKRMIVKQNNKRIDLTKTEYDLLVFFIGSEGIVQTREALLEKIWNLQFFEGSNIVDVHIKSLRKKLNDSAVDPNYIVTVRGVGYRLADL